MYHEKLKACISKLFRVSSSAGCITKFAKHTTQSSKRTYQSFARRIFAGCTAKSTTCPSPSCSCSMLAGCTTKRSKRTSRRCSFSFIFGTHLEKLKVYSSNLFVFYFAGCTIKSSKRTSQSCSCFYVCGMLREKPKACISELLVFYVCGKHQEISNYTLEVVLGLSLPHSPCKAQSVHLRSCQCFCLCGMHRAKLKA